LTLSPAFDKDHHISTMKTKEAVIFIPMLSLGRMRERW